MNFEDDPELFSPRFDNEYSQYYHSFSQGNWADKDPEKCLCRGSGWALSDVDTWHQCRVHYNGQRHPEDDYPDPTLMERFHGFLWRTKEKLKSLKSKMYNLIHKDDVPF